MEDPSLYRVLFLIARALAGLNTPRCASVGPPPSGRTAAYGFTLTGNVDLSYSAVPVPDLERSGTDAISTSSPANAPSMGRQFAELSGTVAASPDCMDSITINFYQAGQLVRTLHSPLPGGNGSESQMKQTMLPLQNDSIANSG